MKQLIKQAITKFTGMRTYGDFAQTAASAKKEAEAKIPRTDLSEEHIEGAKVLVNRQALLKLMPANSVCCEIGVNKGDFSNDIINICRPKKLHLIDAWGDDSRYHDGLKRDVEKKFENEIRSGQVEINLGYSTGVLLQFPDHYFDWVYLDTDHSYKLTSQELILLNDKVKPGGIICGHDYIMGNWAGGVRYGVIEAVHEFCVSHFWKIKYITINIGESPSFAIERI